MKLMICPFCKSESVKLIKNTPTAMPGSIVTYAYIKCLRCEAQGPKMNDWGNKNFEAQALQLWNKR